MALICLLILEDFCLVMQSYMSYIRIVLIIYYFGISRE